MSKQKISESYIITLTVHVCGIIIRISSSAFSVASFSGLSDVHESSGGFQLPLVAIGVKELTLQLSNDVMY